MHKHKSITALRRSQVIRHSMLALGWLTNLISIGFLGMYLTYPIYAENTPITGVVYVESNIPTPNGNSILAYRRNDAGELIPLPGSPFPAGGAGVGDPDFTTGPFDSDQNIIVNPEGTRLFAVNSGSNSIAVFDILDDGRLVPVEGSPFPSGGVNPVSLGLAGDTLYVVNKNMDPAQDETLSVPNYTGFQVTPEGRLIPIPRSTVEVSDGASPSQALLSPDDRFLFGADFLGPVLQVFLIQSDGRLLQGPNTPQRLPDSEFEGTEAPHWPLGLQVHPTQPILYVGFPTVNKLGIYTYDDRGAITFLQTVPNSGAALCWIAINKAGTLLYTTNTGDNSVSVYDLTNPTTPAEIQVVKLSGSGGPFQAALDPSESFLHVVSQRTNPDAPSEEANLLHILQVDAEDGTLTEVPSSPLALPVPDTARPQGIAAR